MNFLYIKKIDILFNCGGGGKHLKLSNHKNGGPKRTYIGIGMPLIQLILLIFMLNWSRGLDSSPKQMYINCNPRMNVREQYITRS